MNSGIQPPERRAHRRFALQTPLVYRPAGPSAAAWKAGTALDMSAGGIRIRIPEAVAPGAKLELAMEWNGLYHGRERMRLHVTASVARTDSRGTVLRILNHEFRDAHAAKAIPRCA